MRKTDQSMRHANTTIPQKYLIRNNAIKTKVFNFHNTSLVITTKLQTRTAQKIAMLEYKVDRGSGGNLLPTSMLKTIFPRYKSVDLDRSINKKIVLEVYDNSYIQQFGACRQKNMQKCL